MNTIGKLFRVTTFGESHGLALGCVVDGCPAGILLTEKDIQSELDRRKPGQSPLTTPRVESDKVKILSGIFEGKTLGTPIAMIVENKDCRGRDYEKLKNVFRPGHADFTWEAKYGFRDFRGGGRQSGRETVARVMAGAVAKKILAQKGISCAAHASEIGGISGSPKGMAAPPRLGPMAAAIERAKGEGDSIGGIVEIVIKGVPAGLGEPVFGKLSADLAHALVSIPAVKGIEFGSGFAAVAKKGSEQNDPMHMEKGKVVFDKNDAGGLLGGISTGQDIVMRIAVKPTSSISKPQETVTKDGKNIKIQVTGRHDPCIVPRILPVAESMAAIVIADHLLLGSV